MVLLGVMVFIALGILYSQFDFDPTRWRMQADENSDPKVPGLSQEALVSLASSAVVDGLEPMSPPEYFDAGTLSDKINGKAELYLASGFEFLESRRLVPADDSGFWIERFVYDMGAYPNAFAVFSQQRREGVRTMDLTPDAYLSANGVFFVHGPHYVEIIGSDTSEPVMDGIIELARTFVSEHPVTRAVLDERGLLPERGRVADSITMTASNAFGFEGFDNIYSARYQMEDLTAIAYVSRRTSSEEAAGLADDYVRFLMSYGGGQVDPPEGAPPVRIIEILDYIQIVFSHGPYLAGVNEAEDLRHGLALASELYDRIKGESDER